MINPEINVKFAARGILIVLVTLGHNHLFRDHFYYSWYLCIYAFHVGSFFLIATLSPPRPITGSVVTGLIRKILLPFFVALVVYWAIFTAANLHQSGGTLAPWFEKLFSAILFENAWVLREAVDLKMLWFLPAFFMFCLVYNIYGLTKGWTLYLFIGVAVVLHVLVGVMPHSSLYYVPFSANVVAFLIFPSLLFSAIEGVIREKISLQAASIIVFAAASTLALRSSYVFELGDSLLPDWHRPLALLLGDCQLIFGCISVLVVSRWLQGVRVLIELGKRSLQLYLLHPLVNVAATMLFARMLPWPYAMVLATASTIILTYLLALATGRFAFSAYIFGIPRPAGTSRVSEAA